MLPAAAMTMPAFLRSAAPLLLAASLAACVQPPATPPETHAAAAPPPPAPPSERLNLALHSDNVDWVSVGSGALGGGEGQEYVPAGQTIADWTQMITVLTLPPSQNPSASLAAILNGVRGACKTYRVIHATARDDTTRTANLLARCDQPDDTAVNNPNALLLKHEVIWAKTLEGQSDNYVVLRSWHANTIPPDSVVRSADVRQQWQDWVDQVSVVPNGA
jgi:hypothetical protein